MGSGRSSDRSGASALPELPRNARQRDRPIQTRFDNTTYEFSVKLKAGDEPEGKKRPFDELRLAWHDYPGEWFTDDPSSLEERDRRTYTFISLLRSDVALLLADGQKLLDYAGEEERYLKSLLGNFRQNLLRLNPDPPMVIWS